MMSKVTIYNELIGKKITNIVKGKSTDIYNENGDVLIFITKDDSYMFYHDQDCCEEVYIDQIDGDLYDLTYGKIIQAESVSNCERSCDDDISTTWTFYKFATDMGHSITVKWYGSSNGYYSEEVEFRKL